MVRNNVFLALSFLTLAHCGSTVEDPFGGSGVASGQTSTTGVGGQGGYGGTTSSTSTMTGSTTSTTSTGSGLPPCTFDGPQSNFDNCAFAP